MTWKSEIDELKKRQAFALELGGEKSVAFQHSLGGRRGQLAKVATVDGDSVIRVGDPVVVTGRRGSALA